MNRETKPVPFPTDGHPDENQLLLALERELPSEESAQIEQHLGNCWNCRARSEEMQRGILAFIEYREKRYLPSLKPPPNEYGGFPGQLRAVAGERPRVGLFARIRHKLFPPFILSRQVKWASVVATGMVLVLLWTEVFHPPTLTAGELLTRAMVAQNPPQSSAGAAPVRIARQKVEIQSENRTTVQEFEWVVGQPIARSAWGSPFDPLHWSAPLTAEGFVNWRAGLKDKEDRVSRSGDFLKIETVSAGDFVQAATMVIREKDFHPVEQHLRFADHRQLDLKEIAFEILDQPLTTQRAPARGETAQLAPARPPKEEPVVSAQELDEIELQLRYTLFRHQWDLGEDLTIERGADRVILGGIVSSRERADAIQGAVSAHPHVQLLLSSPGTLPNASPDSRTARTISPQTKSSDPLLRTQLADAFPARDDRQAFVDGCLAASDTALSHVWALKRLADRYPPAAEQQFSSESQTRLRTMVRGHLEELGRANRGLQRLVELIPASGSGSPPAIDSWRSGVSLLLAQVQEQDTFIAELVVGARAISPPPAAVFGKFIEDHSSIDATVRGSIRQLAGGNAHGRP